MDCIGGKVRVIQLPPRHAAGRRRPRRSGIGAAVMLGGSWARLPSAAALLLILYLVMTSGPVRRGCAALSTTATGLGLEEEEEGGKGENDAMMMGDHKANNDVRQLRGTSIINSKDDDDDVLLGSRPRRRVRRSGLPKNGKIKHVVVLVMENRSFDHLLGFMKRRNPDIDGLNGNESNSLNATDPFSPRVVVSDAAEYVDPDPGHSYQAITEQIFGGNATWQLAQDPPPMSGFAQNAEALYPNTGFPQRVMSAFRPEAVPSYAALAEEFAVFDRWFASVPASTEPNRFYVHSATSHGAMSNFRPALIRGFPQKSIFQSLDENGLSFGVYFNNAPTTLFFRGLRAPKFATRFHTFLRFKFDARMGRLPNYAVIEPRYFDLYDFPANDDHPSHDVSRGQMLVKEVYETLRHSPSWKSTLLIITYDEHGGFYDHVPTPVSGVPNPDGLIGPPPYDFDFSRLGVRVPTIMVSPWINKGKVYHCANGPTPTSEYEHSSIPATVRKIFKLKDEPLTKREAWAGTFEHILTERDTPRDDCPKNLPEVNRLLRSTPAKEDAIVTEFQKEIVEMAAMLSGDTATADNAHRMNVREANYYVEKQVHDFLSKNLVLQAELEAKSSSLLQTDTPEGPADVFEIDDSVQTAFPSWWRSFEALSSAVEHGNKSVLAAILSHPAKVEPLPSVKLELSSSSWSASFGALLESIAHWVSVPETQSLSSAALQEDVVLPQAIEDRSETATSDWSSTVSRLRDIFGRRWGPHISKDMMEDEL